MASKKAFRWTGPLCAAAAWAVGGTNWFSPSQTLADHWNGRSWTRFSTPGSGYFNAVATTSATNAWAVGLVGPGPGIVAPTTALIEHWNGKHWTEQSVKPVRAAGRSRGSRRSPPPTRGRSARPARPTRRP